MGGAGDCAELPKGFGEWLKKRLEAGLNGLVIVENTSGQFFVESFFFHRFYSVVLGVWNTWAFS